jgi:hypothetical protein
MIGVMTYNPDTIFLEKLNLPITFIDENDEVDGLFIDWVPKIPVYEDAWMAQASLLQKYIKLGIPIVIFDRLFSLTEKEVNWIKKFNTYLFEPALNSGRIGFNYLPEWIHNFEIYEKEDREYDFVYSHNRLEYNLNEFEKWVKDYARLFPNKKVAYSSTSISDFKKEEFKRDNLVFIDSKNHIYNIGNTTIAIDTKKSYEIGYFNPMYFFAMNLGCLPFLPVDHKYFHSMFKGLVINDIRDMDYYISLFSNVKYVVIEEIFDRIKREWNEFTIDHAVDVVRNCYE